MSNLWIALFLIVALVACNNNPPAAEESKDAATTQSPAKAVDGGPKTDPDSATPGAPDTSGDTSEPDEPASPPCCHGMAKLRFDGLDIEGTLSGIQDPPVEKTKYAVTVAFDPQANLEGYQLKVMADMPGMNHHLRFPVEKENQTYQMKAVVFTMPGDWTVSFSLEDEADPTNSEGCSCQWNVKKKTS